MFKQSIFSVINRRVAIVILDALFVFWLYSVLELKMMVDLYIISIAIIFPLVFTITSAYNKRQESLAHFSLIRTKIIELSNIFSAVKEIPSSKKKTFNQLLLKTHKEVHITLSNSSKQINKYILRRRSKEIYDFVEKELNVLKKQLFRELKINPYSWALI